MLLPGEINFVVTTHKINNSERNSGHSSTERNSIITGRELQHSPSSAEEFSLSLDYLYQFICRSVFPHKNWCWTLWFPCQNEEFDLRTQRFSRFFQNKLFSEHFIIQTNIFIVQFSLVFPVLMLLSRAFGITRENCAHTIMRLRQRLCPVSAESQMHTSVLWKNSDMQRRSARRWAVRSLGCPAFQIVFCCIMKRSSSTQTPLIHQAVPATLKGNQRFSTSDHL